MAVAVSGGIDSTALLHCTARVAQSLGLRVHALHVHHGLQGAADSWVRHLRRQVSRWQCEGLPLSLHVRRLVGAPQPGDSVEAWARRERFAALSEMAREAGCSLVLLAHHRRDQAETFLLQALRGGGAAGLAAMPASVEREGLRWCRPWLNQPREAIEAYAQRHHTSAVSDPSNADPRYARSRLRGPAWQTLLAAFPDAESALGAAARRAATEATALREWAEQELAALGACTPLPVARWLALAPARRDPVLRAWLRREGSHAPEALVARLMAELPIASAAAWPEDARHRLVLYRGLLRRQALAEASSIARRRPVALATSTGTSHGADWPCDLSQPGDHRPPAWPGVLRVAPTGQGGIDPVSLRNAALRPRSGGEKFQLGPKRPARGLKRQFQALGIAAEQRDAPLVVVGDEVVYVPGLGIDARWLASHGVDGSRDLDAGPGLTLAWLPDAVEPTTQG